MAKLMYISTTSVDMPNIMMSPGQILYCADIPITYYDTTGGKRVVFDNIKYCFSETDRHNIGNIKGDCLYCVTSTGKFYRWSLATDWRAATYTADIYDIVDISETLVPGTMSQNGTNVAPKTLATQVFTKDGERVEDVLGDITRVGKTYRYIPIETQGQTEFDLPLPFENYFGLGNYIEVYIGSVWVAPTRYSIEIDDSVSPTTAKLVFNSPEDVLLEGREISVIYTYNTGRVKGGVYYGFDGHYIVNGTIPINKIEKYSSDFTLDDGTSVATNKAVYNSYEALNSKLNAIAGNLIAHAISYNTGFELKADIENFTLVDNSTIYLKLHTDIMPGATLTVNGGNPIPIYLNYKQAIKAGLKEGDVLSLTYSKLNNKFFVNASVAYKLSHYRYVYDCQGGESTIAIDIADFEPGYDNLHVTHNNLKLIENVNYTIDGHNLVLAYTANEGDVIEMEMDKVSGNGLPVNGNTIMEDITFVQDVILKGDVNFEGSITLPNGSYISSDGNMYINGSIVSEGAVTAPKFISTIKDGEPPFIVESTTVVPNLNADMVDDYHAIDLAIPDNTIEFIIDGESEIMDANIQIALRSFLGRIEAISDRMMKSDATDTIKAQKQSYETVAGKDYEWPKDEPLANENIRDTIEEIVYQMDVVNYKILSTQSPEDIGIALDDINNMLGNEIPKDNYVAPEPIKLLMTWDEVERYIDALLFEIEEKMLIAVPLDASDNEILDAHEAVVKAYTNIDINEYNVTGNSRVDTQGKTQETALRAKYLKTDGKRFYPITHKNAIVGMPFGDVATAKSVTKLKDEANAHDRRIQYLEEVIQQLLSGGSEESGNTGKLIMLEGIKVPVYNTVS